MRNLSSPFKIQNYFHTLITNYFSGDLFSNFEMHFLFPLMGVKICAHYAGEIIDNYNYLKKIISNTNNSRIIEKKNVKPYSGRNPSVFKLKRYLEENVDSYLLGAFIHGSLATDDEIHYSDFDALLVFKNQIFSNEEILAEVCYKILKAKRILNEYDPLQHHGFFILTELDLNYYCQEYFPVVLFDFSKSLFEEKGLNLSFQTRPSFEEGFVAFREMIRAIKNKLEFKRYPKNYCELKLILSQMMLLPSLYLQARGIYVFKRDSFPLAKKDFSNSEWEVMDKITLIRNKWDFRPSSCFQNLKKAIKNPFFDSSYQKMRGQPLSSMIKAHINEEFYSSMLTFVNSMELKIRAYEEEMNRGTIFNRNARCPC